MGNRISIQFRDENEELSPVLFSHWDGKDLLTKVQGYYAELYAYSVRALQEDLNTPLSRMEAQTVMVDFIRVLTTGQGRVTSNYYLGVDENDGDNSDNGHHIFDLYQGGWIGGKNGFPFNKQVIS